MAPIAFNDSASYQLSFLDKFDHGEDYKLRPLEEMNVLEWIGGEFQVEDYIYELSSKDLREVKLGLDSFKSLGIDGGKANRSTFPLPALQEKLLSLATELHNGKGFCVVRGLNPNEFSVEDNLLLYLGISSYIGEMRAKQTLDGYMLEHIHNAQDDLVAEEARPFRHSKRAGTFHSDNFCDILAFQILGCSETGGNTILASSEKICNTLRERRPDILDALTQPDWSFSRNGSTNFERRPLLYYHGGRAILNFVRHQLTGQDGSTIKNETQAPLPEKQLEALNIIEDLAKEFQLVLHTNPGDLVFINNYGLLHSREAFEDSPERTRHFVRLWLKNKDLAWSLPEPIRSYNEQAFNIDDEKQRWNILPSKKINSKTYVRERWSCPG